VRVWIRGRRARAHGRPARVEDPAGSESGPKQRVLRGLSVASGRRSVRRRRAGRPVVKWRQHLQSRAADRGRSAAAGGGSQLDDPRVRPRRGRALRRSRRPRRRPSPGPARIGSAPSRTACARGRSSSLGLARIPREPRDRHDARLDQVGRRRRSTEGSCVQRRRPARGAPAGATARRRSRIRPGRPSTSRRRHGRRHLEGSCGLRSKQRGEG